MADANVRALQYTLNRYAPVAGFAAIGTDGIMGANTGEAILHALAWVANNDPTEEDTAAGLTQALVNTDGSLNLTQMSSSASGLNTFLGQEADGMRIKASQPVVAVSSGSVPSIPNLPGPKTPVNVGANVFAGLSNLPLWAKIAGGAIAGIGGIAAYQHMKKRHGGLKGFFGFAR
jgi:hypothetical protein